MPAAVSAGLAIRAHVRRARPDLALLVGNDFFNAALGRWLRRHGVPAVSLFPPQIWLWRRLAPLFRDSFDEILASFPDEADGYRAAGIPTRFVGHYLANLLHPVTDGERRDARQALGCDDGRPVVAFLPGSRRHEIDRLLPWMLGAGAIMQSRTPGLHVLVASLEAHRPAIERVVAQRPGVEVRVARDSHATMRAADLVVCCSGTATLEAALLEVPTIVLYRLSRLSHGVVRTAVRAGLLPPDPIALPNLILGTRVVQEFTRWRCTAEDVAAAALRLLDDASARRVMAGAFGEVRRRVHAEDTMERVTRCVLERARTARDLPAPDLVGVPSPLRHGE